ncbi:MAG TPA: hypothetical protein VFA15_04105 [Nitrososphaera sp.]|nr:hypothetical protein [Nitrososphaera sp.]
MIHDSERDDSDDASPSDRANVLALLDSFLDRIAKIRETMIAISTTSIVQAPVAIALSLYLLFNPSFLRMIRESNDFGGVLIVLFALVIASSAYWFIVGIRNYHSMREWMKEYREFKQSKEERERQIAMKYGLE